MRRSPYVRYVSVDFIEGICATSRQRLPSVRSSDTAHGGAPNRKAPCMLRAMRVIYVAPNIQVPGTHGGSTHVTEVFRNLGRLNDAMLIAKRGSSGAQVVPVGFEAFPPPFRHVPPLMALPAAYRAARRFAPHVIYERGSALGLGAALSQLTGAALVTMVLDRSVSPISLRKADAIVTTAPHMVPGRFHQKLHRVWWGANIDHFNPSVDGREVREKLEFAPDEFVVGYSGGFYPWHGLETIVDAAQDLRNEPVRFMLLGDGQLFSKIQRQVERRGLQHKILMPGRVSYADVPQYIAACDVCAAPFNPAAHPVMRKQGFYFDPLKVFEYLAMKKPTITLDSPNIRGLFEPRKHVLLVPPRRPDALRDAIIELKRDDALRENMGSAGREIVESKYSWRAHGKHLTEIFHQVTNTTP